MIFKNNDDIKKINCVIFAEIILDNISIGRSEFFMRDKLIIIAISGNKQLKRLFSSKYVHFMILSNDDVAQLIDFDDSLYVNGVTLFQDFRFLFEFSPLINWQFSFENLSDAFLSTNKWCVVRIITFLIVNFYSNIKIL